MFLTDQYGAALEVISSCFCFFGISNFILSYINMDLSPVAIKEANHHIQGLMKRNHELEEQVKELSAALRKQNEAHAENLKILPLRMNQTMKQKDDEIAELRQKLQKSEAAVEKLSREAREREAIFQHMKNRSRVLDEIVKHRDTFESILTCLSILEGSEYYSFSAEDGERTENGFQRETDLLDSYAEDINGNTGVSMNRDRSVGTSSSSVDLETNGKYRQEMLGQENPFSEVYTLSDEKPAPHFV